MKKKLEGQPHTGWTIGTTLRARSALKLGSAGGMTEIVSEMILALSTTAVYDTHEQFLRRFHDDENLEDMSSWRNAAMLFLQKVGKPLSCLNNQRGVFLLEVCLKWYINCLC